MASRLELQTFFEALLGSSNVYFQPPTNIQMQYPCIIYRRENSESRFADNRSYKRTKMYQVTVVDRNPDTEFPGKVEDMRYCSFDRYFPADNLNHYVFTLFF